MKDKTSSQNKTENSELTVIESPNDLTKPQKDTEFAHASAKVLMDIVKKNHWARKLGGQSEHLQYEAWQTVGKYYGYLVKTFDAEPVEIGGVVGFKAKACVVNEKTGVQVGGAEAYCMKDEENWKNKPLFQLASMAQTRAGSKALRQNLGFVVALAGFEPTPYEEMTDGEIHTDNKEYQGKTGYTMTVKQRAYIKRLLSQKGFTEKQLCNKYDVTSIDELTGDQASQIIENLMKLQDKTQEDDIDLNEVDKALN